MPKSLTICICTYVILIIAAVIMRTGLVKEVHSLWIGALLYALWVFTIFCIFPAFMSLVIGMQELKTRETKVLSGVSVLGGLVLIILYFVAIKKLWPTMMGI